MSSSTVLRLKNELQTAGDLMELMDVIKQVAASQFLSLQGKWFKSGRAGLAAGLTTAIEDCFRLIPPDQCLHPLLEQPTGPGPSTAPLGLVMVTSNEGFVAGLNVSVIQAALSAPGGQQAELILVGERGQRYLRDMRRQFTPFPGMGSEIDRRVLERLRDYIVNQYQKGNVGRVWVFYTRLLSFTHQEVESFQLLPYRLPEPSPEDVRRRTAFRMSEMILEPSASSVIEYLVRVLVGRKIEEALWQGRLSELAARTLHLETSVQTLAERQKKLRFQYFRSKHEATDTSIRETYAGLLLGEKAAKVPAIQDRLEERV